MSLPRQIAPQQVNALKGNAQLYEALRAIVDSHNTLIARLGEVLDTGTPANGVGLLLRRDRNGVASLEAVTLGATDSGGAGFKLLRVPN